jgi:hypothetical protein
MYDIIMFDGRTGFHGIDTSGHYLWIIELALYLGTYL